MDRAQIQSTFDQQAPTYDRQWAKLAPLRECLHLLLAAVFAPLPATARILCVGAGTGAEVQHLAAAFPGWTFTAVEPSARMLDECRARAVAQGYADRCVFHAGYVDTLPATDRFDAATCFLVSQFILDRAERIGFFGTLAERLHPGGLLASSDLASDLTSAAQTPLLEAWFRTMSAADVPRDALQRMREAYARDVAVLPSTEVEAIVRAGGFEAPVRFFQAGLIHAWFARRTPASPGTSVAHDDRRQDAQ